MSRHGTAYSLEQCGEVLVALTRALPKVLEGTDPKQVIKALDKRGEELGSALSRALLAMLEPDRFTVGGLTFEVVPFLREGKGKIGGKIGLKELLSRAEELGADLGQEQADHLYEHWTQIPEVLRGYHFVFTKALRKRYSYSEVLCLQWLGAHCRLRWLWFDGSQPESSVGTHARLLRLCE